MPRAVDRRQLEADYDPNRSGTEMHVAGMVKDRLELLASILEEALETTKAAVIDLIKELTGLDLTSFETFLASLGEALSGGGGIVDNFAEVLVSLVSGLLAIPGVDTIIDLIESLVLGGGGADAGFPYTFPITFGGEPSPAGEFFKNLRWFFDAVDFTNPAFDFDASWDHFISTTPIGELVGTVQQNVQKFLNLGWQSLVNDDEGLIDRTAEEFADALKNIPALNVVGVGAATLVDTVTDLLDNFWSGFTRSTGSGKSIADATNAATKISGQAAMAEDLSVWNNAILELRNNKSLMSGMDETSESNFLLSDLLNGAGDPPTVAATATSVPVSFWRATETALKGFISWYGKGVTNVTSLVLDLYKLDPATNTWTLFHTSPDQIGPFPADDSWKLGLYYLPTGDRFQVNAGDIFGVAWRVTGAGTHRIAGKLGGWLPPDTSGVYPTKPGATRTGTLTGSVAASAVTYTGDVGWFGIGIAAGDIPMPYNAPRPTEYSTPGTYTYSIPPWANYIDSVLNGGGGGGCGGNPAFGWGGEGGYAGVWQGETLVRGIDFPSGATTLTITVGAGGAAGPSNNPGGVGGDSVRAAISGGKAALTATGGARGDEQGVDHYSGSSTGSFTFNGVTYVGGTGGVARAASPGTAATSPGAGGGGGGGGTWAIAWPGGAGARGGAWLTARQT